MQTYLNKHIIIRKGSALDASVELAYVDRSRVVPFPSCSHRECHPGFWLWLGSRPHTHAGVPALFAIFATCAHEPPASHHHQTLHQLQ